jgi:hypothetical protein
MLKGTLTLVGKNIYTDKFNRPYAWGRVIITGEEKESYVMITMRDLLFVKTGTEITVHGLPKSNGYDQSYVMEPIYDFNHQVSLMEKLVEHKVAELLAEKGM